MVFMGNNIKTNRPSTMTTRMLCRIGENDLGHSSYGNKQSQDLSGLRQEEFLSSEVHFAKLPKAAVLQALAQYARVLGSYALPYWHSLSYSPGWDKNWMALH